MTFETIEHANFQLALDEVQANSESWAEFGLSPDIGNYSGVSLASLVGGFWQGPAESARQFSTVDISATETIQCLRAGVVLGEHGGDPVALTLSSLTGIALSWPSRSLLRPNRSPTHSSSTSAS